MYILILWIIINIFDVQNLKTNRETIPEAHLQFNKNTISTNCQDKNQCETQIENLSETQVKPNIDCNLNQISLNLDHGNSGLNPDSVKRNYANPGEIQLSTMNTYGFSCMDDRITQPSIMIPGGDMGEFLLGLYTLSNLSVFSEKPLKLDQSAIIDMLKRYLTSISKQRKFIHCTDEYAIQKIEKQFELVDLDLISPPLRYQSQILNLLGKSQYNGDVHIRLLLTFSEEYKLPLDYIQQSLRALYTILWDTKDKFSKNIDIITLYGSHNAKAFIEIDEGENCIQKGMVALIKPKISDYDQNISSYIMHTRAVQERRKELAIFLSNELEKIVPLHNIEDKIILSKLNRHGLIWLEKTTSLISKDLNYYNLIFVHNE